MQPTPRMHYDPNTIINPLIITEIDIPRRFPSDTYIGHFLFQVGFSYFSCRRFMRVLRVRLTE